MKSRSKVFALLALLLGVGLFYGGSAILRARQDLVTLDVRNMEVRKVVRKIERQTWERILVHKDVQGKVTLKVRKVPLDEVLRILGEQTFSRSSLIYPLYSSKKSLAKLEKSVRGEIEPSQNGWTNLQSRSFFRGGPMFGGPMFGGPAPIAADIASRNERVSLQIQDKDLQFATLALARFGQARVVPEDGTSATINLMLKEVSSAQAVKQLARKARRNWTKIYVLRNEFWGFGPGGPPEFAARQPGAERRAERESTSEERDQFRKEREALEDQLRQTLPEAERQRLEAAQQQRQQEFQQMQNLSPEQRRERFGQMNRGGMDRRNLDRLKNSTPEQRAEQRRRMMQMRGRDGQRPGPPGPR